MLIYLIRHGETQYNAQGRYQGWSDVPLSPAGRAALTQAGFSPEYVYVSPLCRAVETAEILFPQAKLVPIPALKEMCFGAFEGRSYREMEHDAAYCSWIEGGCTGRCPGGENRKEFSVRVCTAFSALVDTAWAAGQERLVIVAHGGTQMALLDRWGQPRQDYFAWQRGHGGGFVLDARNWPEQQVLELVGEVNYTKD